MLAPGVSPTTTTKSAAAVAHAVETFGGLHIAANIHLGHSEYARPPGVLTAGEHGDAARPGSFSGSG